MTVKSMIPPHQNKRSAPPRYTLTDLGTLGGDQCFSQDINNQGQVVGYGKTASGNTLAFIWENGRMRSLGALPGYPSSYALKINEAGQVVGYCESGWSKGFPRAFLWQNDQMQDLGTLPGYKYSAAADINDKGQVLGTSIRVIGPVLFLPWPWQIRRRLFLWESGKMRELRVPNHKPLATALNNAGDVQGIASTKNGGVAFLRRADGTVIDLGTFGGRFSNSYHLDDDGRAVGEAQTAGEETHAFLYSGGKMEDLGTLPGHKYGSAHGINQEGWIVGGSGVSLTAPKTWRAFIYRDGVMHDLNEFIPRDSGYTLTGASAINDRGQIACHAEKDGKRRAVLLTPQE